jgi:predicted 3-demethylubiquinone-9 3-methyltransferase (glyoxalase superfamily)
MSVTPFLMFEGKCAEAVEFYVATVGGEIAALEKRDDGGVQHCAFSLRGNSYRGFDSPAKHAFTFTPALSLFVDCESEAEIDRLYAAFIDGGSALMPLGNYGFSRKFGWLNDRFGVSWQFNYR